MVRELLKEIAEDKHKGIEMLAVKYVLNRLPQNAESIDEIRSLIREFAVDSVHEYKPDSEAKFSTFLRYNLIWKAQKWFRRRANKISSCVAIIGYESGKYQPVETAMQIRELIDALTPSSREMFTLLVNTAGVPSGVRTLGPGRIASITGKPVNQCASFVRELRSRCGEYV